MTIALRVLAAVLLDWFDVYVLRHRWYGWCKFTATRRGWDYCGTIILKR